MLIRLDGPLTMAEQEVGDGVQEVVLTVAPGVVVTVRLNTENSDLHVRATTRYDTDMSLRLSLD